MPPTPFPHGNDICSTLKRANKVLSRLRRSERTPLRKQTRFVFEVIRSTIFKTVEHRKVFDCFALCAATQKQKLCTGNQNPSSARITIIFNISDYPFIFTQNKFRCESHPSPLTSWEYPVYKYCNRFFRIFCTPY